MPSWLRSPNKSKRAARKSELDSSITTSSTSQLGISEIRLQVPSSPQLDASIIPWEPTRYSQPSTVPVTTLEPASGGIVGSHPEDLWTKAYNDLLDDQEVCRLPNVNGWSLVSSQRF